MSIMRGTTLAAIEGVGGHCPTTTVAGERLNGRSIRVGALLSLVLVLSLVDLSLTVQHLTTIGFAESNPIAAWLIRVTRSTAVLALYKLFTVLIAVGGLFLVRRHRIAEVASWGAAIILIALCWRWQVYASTVAESMTPLAQLSAPLDHDWIRLDGSGTAR